MYILWENLPWRVFVVSQESQRHIKGCIWSASGGHISTLAMFASCSCAVKINVKFVLVFCLLTKDGRPAPELCFKKVNEAGNMYGNCGKDVLGRYRSCKDR